MFRKERPSADAVETGGQMRGTRKARRKERKQTAKKDLVSKSKADGLQTRF